MDGRICKRRPNGSSDLLAALSDVQRARLMRDAQADLLGGSSLGPTNKRWALELVGSVAGEDLHWLQARGAGQRRAPLGHAAVVKQGVVEDSDMNDIWGDGIRPNSPMPGVTRVLSVDTSCADILVSLRHQSPESKSPELM